MNYVEELMKVSTRADLFLTPPRVVVERTADDPVLGPASASVEIVAFGDFESVEYARLAQAFGKVRETFGDRVRIVFKHLPVAAPDSAAAAEAAACANAQGGFWPYHDAVLARPGPFSAEQLKEVASDARLDRRAFDRCVDDDQFRSLPKRAMEEAQRYAIEASPSFLVNGALAPTPPPFLPPFEFFKRIIEEELQRQSRASLRP
jgi:protein-disulfide isomerase